MINRRGERQINSGPVTTPQEPAGFLFDGDDLPFGRVRVHPAAAADRNVLDRSLDASHPPHLQRRPDALIVGIRAADVSVIRVPVEFRIGEVARECAANLMDVEILRRQFLLRGGRIPVRAEHVQVPVLAAEIDSPVGNRR